jgi:hypothetical protein
VQVLIVILQREAHKMVIASRDEYDSLHRKAKVKDESTEIKRAKLVQVFIKDNYTCIAFLSLFSTRINDC